MISLGITGGIGSGKSVVAELLRTMGIPVYDSDAESKRLTVTDIGIRSELIQLVGPQVFDSDGSLCKPAFASWLFSADAHVKQVNAIIHPVVRRDFNEWKARQAYEGCRACAIESAILYEASFEDVVDKVIVVTAPLEKRIERTMQRDGADREAVINRIKRQLDDAEKIRRADFVILNDEEKSVIAQLSSIVDVLFEKNV